MYVYLAVYMNVHHAMYVPGVCRGQKEASDPLKEKK